MGESKGARGGGRRRARLARGLPLGGLLLAMGLMWALIAGPMASAESPFAATSDRPVGGPRLSASNLVVTATGSGEAIEICGSSTFTVAVTNLGPDAAVGLLITNTMPVTGFTPPLRTTLSQTLAMSHTITTTFSYDAGCDAIAGDNTTVVGYLGGGELTRYTAFTVNPGAITLQQTAVAVNGTPITPSTSPVASVGDEVTWRIVVSSSGLGPVSNVEVVNEGQSGLEYVSSSPGGSVVGQQVTWTSAQDGDLARMEPGEFVELDVVSLVVDCANLESVSTATWGCGGDDCEDPDQEVTTNIDLELLEPLLDFTPGNTVWTYCTRDITKTVAITNTGDGPAHDIFFEIDFSGYTVSTSSPGASYQSSPTPGFSLPDMAGNDIYTLTYTLHYAGDWCAATPPTGKRYWFPEYLDDCEVIFRTPVRRTEISVASAAPALN